MWFGQVSASGGICHDEGGVGEGLEAHLAERPWGCCSWLGALPLLLGPGSLARVQALLIPVQTP